MILFRKLKINPLFAVCLAVLLLTDKSHFAAMTLLAAFLHECGHLLAAKFLQVPLERLSLDFLGARLCVSGRMLSYSEEWLLCAAGPLFSLLFSALGAFFWRWEQGRIFSCASLLLGVLNLLPIRSFDGGRMLEALLYRRFSVRAADRIMRVTSFLFLMLLWGSAAYLLLRAGSGLSLFCFSLCLTLRLFE